MATSLNTRQEILNTLSDSGKSVSQIEKSLEREGVDFEHKNIIKVVSGLLSESKLYVRYPVGLKLSNLDGLEEDDLENIWFEMTPDGRAEWAKIEIE